MAMENEFGQADIQINDRGYVVSIKITDGNYKIMFAACLYVGHINLVS